MTNRDLADLLHRRTGVSLLSELNPAAGGKSELATQGPLDLHGATVRQLLSILRNYAIHQCDPPLVERNNTDYELDIRRVYNVGDLLSNTRLWSAIPLDGNSAPVTVRTRQECQSALMVRLGRMRSKEIENDRAEFLLRDQLILTAAPETHEMVADLLEVLRRIADAQKAAK
jgi:hypothetical protein